MQIRSLIPRLLSSLTAAVVVAAAGPIASAADAPTGEQIYKKQCIKCHGAAGEGSKEYPHALAGEKQLPQLAKLIAKTMPDNDPGSLSADDAVKVAAYVFDTYYSREAREKNQLPRV